MFKPNINIYQYAALSVKGIFVTNTNNCNDIFKKIG
jgi:hypothetical protein